MSERVLEISEKAMEALHKMGDEAFVIIRRLGSGWGARQAALVESGKPPNIEGYLKLEKDGVTVWTPGEISFPDNVVRIDKKGFLWNTYLEAELPIKPGRGGCGG